MRQGIDALPICAVCGRAVDSVETYRDTMRRREVFIARCHGDVEEVALTDAAIVGADSISVGQAFATKRLVGETR